MRTYEKCFQGEFFFFFFFFLLYFFFFLFFFDNFCVFFSGWVFFFFFFFLGGFFYFQAWDWKLVKVAHISATKWFGISLEWSKLFNIHRGSWKSKPFPPGSNSSGLIFTGEISRVDSAGVLRQVVFAISFSICFFLFLFFFF